MPISGGRRAAFQREHRQNESWFPLTDSDRAPWLAAIRDRILKFSKRGENLVIGCSALKQEYREFIARDIPITWVYLKGSAELIRSRLKHRSSHFMKAYMLASQFDVLEEPSTLLSLMFHRRPVPSWRRSWRDCGNQGQFLSPVRPTKMLKTDMRRGEEVHVEGVSDVGHFLRDVASKGGNK